MVKLSARLLSVLVIACSTAAQAAEGGSGVYLLGLRTTGAGITPPPGIYFSDQFYVYHGDISGRLPTEGGLLPASARADVAVNIATLQWVTPVELLGGRLGLSATVPFGRLSINGNVGPLSLEDSVTTFADPILTTFIGWKSGNLFWQLGVSGYMPWGDYQKGELANIAKHRLSLDLQGALTYFDRSTGIDVTNVVGVTFNRENEATHYKTGNEFHWDWAVGKKWETGISIAAIGYAYRQLTDDSGPGATLGGFKGRTNAIGLSLGYDFLVGRTPVSTKLRYYHEFDVERRLEGDAAYFSFSVPLAVQRPMQR